VSGVTDALWIRYRDRGDPDARRRLLDTYLGLVHHSARELMPHGVRDIELDDLIGAGTLGLVQALEGFDPARGLAFSTYAMPRIRGAILDELRRRDWMPRTARLRTRHIGRARVALEQRLGREPLDRELAAELGVDEPTLERWLGDTRVRTMVALDTETRSDDGVGTPLAETIPDRRAVDPEAACLKSEQLEGLGAAFAALPEKDRMVLTLYFYESLNLKQIGEVLHVTESRVSQLRTRALARLRDWLALREAA
jgi:RNA polymerase sigma factor for flagellar operon FliA